MSSSMPAQLPSTWDSKALLAKAQRYAEEMLKYHRDDWQFVFWSSLALELIARSALSNISPVLLADPTDWNNIYHALGRIPIAQKFSPKSITITDVFKRLREIFPKFGKELADFCMVHTGRRNAELHSGDTPFDGITNSAWQPSFYQSCEVLLESMGVTLAQFLGPDEAKTAAKLMQASSEKTKGEVARLIKAHETVWLEKDAEERNTLAAQAGVWATRQAGHRVVCPACKSTALLNGEPIAVPKKTFEDDLITETQTFLPTRFECIACGMKISGLSHLIGCGLGDAYKQSLTYDVASYYGFESTSSIFEDDNNEPY